MWQPDGWAAKLVAQVAYRDVTADGILRHATFEHLRRDKRPNGIRRSPLV